MQAMNHVAINVHPSIHLIRRVTIHTSMTEAIETNQQGIQGSQGALTVALFCNKILKKHKTN